MFKMFYLPYVYQGQNFKGSAIHSCMSICLMFFSDNLYIAQFSLLNSLIYFIADLVYQTKPHTLSNVLHHIMSMVVCLAGLCYTPEVCIITSKVCGVFEMSGPAWTGLRLHIENSKEISLPEWYTKKVAGLIFMFIFFYSRFIHLHLYIMTDLPESMPWLIFNSMYVFFMCLNTYWFALIVQGCIKHF